MSAAAASGRAITGAEGPRERLDLDDLGGLPAGEEQQVERQGEEPDREQEGVAAIIRRALPPPRPAKTIDQSVERRRRAGLVGRR